MRFARKIDITGLDVEWSVDENGAYINVGDRIRLRIDPDLRTSACHTLVSLAAASLRLQDHLENPSARDG
jgi:hypothetical protein